MVLQCSQCSLSLTEIIGVDIAGSPFNVNDIQAGAYADALDKINGRDYSTGQSEFLPVGFNPGGLAMPPEPYRIGRQLSLFLAPHIDRMVMKNHLGMIHDVIEFIRTITARKRINDRLAGNVVGRSGAHAVLAASPDHQVPVSHTGVKFDLLAAKLLPERFDQFTALCGRDVPGRKILHIDRAAMRLERYKVHTEGNIIGTEINTH